MTYEDVIEHYGSVQKASKELKIKTSTIYSWKLRDYISLTMQCVIQVRSNGALKVDE